MPRPECDYCKRDISKPSLVRCSSQRCPLKASRGGAVRGILVGIGGLGLIGAFVVVAGAWLLSPGSKPRPVGEDRAEPTPGSPRAAALELSGNVRHWTGGLFAGGSGGSPSEAPVTTAFDPALPDPRAASRVQTFSCSGNLSASRSLICTNWDLATTDYNLALTYNAVLARSRHPDLLRRAHDAFLAGLDTMGSDATKLGDYYRAWQEQLARD